MIIACIPAYNEENNIAKIVIQTLKFVDKIIVCDDGSQDMTAEIAEKVGAIIVKHNRNYGYGAATGTLWREAKKYDPDIMVTIDADGQHDPYDIPTIITPIMENNAEVVIGSRFLGDMEEIPKYREYGIKTITKFVNIASGYNLSDQESGFRAYNKKAMENIQPTENGMGVIMELIIKAAEKNLKVVEVPISITYKNVRKSSLNPVSHALEDIFTTIKFISIRHPFFFYGIPGIILFLVGLYFGIWTLEIYLSIEKLNTNLAVISSALILAGLVLSTTAVLIYSISSIIKDTST